jgi:hypothetical protein
MCPDHAGWRWDGRWSRKRLRGVCAGPDDALFGTAYLLVGDVHQAEDLLQSALEKACRKWRRIQAMELIAMLNVGAASIGEPLPPVSVDLIQELRNWALTMGAEVGGRADVAAGLAPWAIPSSLELSPLDHPATRTCQHWPIGAPWCHVPANP